MRIVFKTYGQVNGLGDAETCDCDVAVVEITPELLEAIRGRCRTAEAVQHETESFCSMEWFDYSAEFYGYELESGIEEVLGDSWLDQGWEVLPDDFDLSPYEKKRTECDAMIVSPHVYTPTEFFWQVSPKHSGIYVTTPTITVEDIVEMLSMNGVVA